MGLISLQFFLAERAGGVMQREEWDGLAAWICNNSLYSKQNVWLIQIPRLYQVYKKQGTMNNFQVTSRGAVSRLR